MRASISSSISIRMEKICEANESFALYTFVCISSGNNSNAKTSRKSIALVSCIFACENVIIIEFECSGEKMPRILFDWMKSNISTAWRQQKCSIMCVQYASIYIYYMYKRLIYAYKYRNNGTMLGHTIVNWKKLHIFIRIHDNKITQASLNQPAHTYVRAYSVVYPSWFAHCTPCIRIFLCLCHSFALDPV